MSWGLRAQILTVGGLVARRAACSRCLRTPARRHHGPRGLGAGGGAGSAKASPWTRRAPSTLLSLHLQPNIHTALLHWKQVAGTRGKLGRGSVFPSPPRKRTGPSRSRTPGLPVPAVPGHRPPLPPHQTDLSPTLRPRVLGACGSKGGAAGGVAGAAARSSHTADPVPCSWAQSGQHPCRGHWRSRSVCGPGRAVQGALRPLPPAPSPALRARVLLRVPKGPGGLPGPEVQTALALPSGHLPMPSELQALLSPLPGSAWPGPVPWGRGAGAEAPGGPRSSRAQPAPGGGGGGREEAAARPPGPPGACSVQAGTVATAAPFREWTRRGRGQQLLPSQPRVPADRGDTATPVRSASTHRLQLPHPGAQAAGLPGPAPPPSPRLPAHPPPPNTTPFPQVPRRERVEIIPHAPNISFSFSLNCQM